MNEGMRFGRDLAIWLVCIFILICGPTTCVNIQRIADSLQQMERQQ